MSLKELKFPCQKKKIIGIKSKLYGKIVELDRAVYKYLIYLNGKLLEKLENAPWKCLKKSWIWLWKSGGTLNVKHTWKWPVSCSIHCHQTPLTTVVLPLRIWEFLGYGCLVWWVCCVCWVQITFKNFQNHTFVNLEFGSSEESKDLLTFSSVLRGKGLSDGKVKL